MATSGNRIQVARHLIVCHATARQGLMIKIMPLNCRPHVARMLVSSGIIVLQVP